MVSTVPGSCGSCLVGSSASADVPGDVVGWLDGSSAGLIVDYYGFLRG